MDDNTYNRSIEYAGLSHSKYAGFGNKAPVSDHPLESLYRKAVGRTFNDMYERLLLFRDIAEDDGATPMALSKMNEVIDTYRPVINYFDVRVEVNSRLPTSQLPSVQTNMETDVNTASKELAGEPVFTEPDTPTEGLGLVYKV